MDDHTHTPSQTHTKRRLSFTDPLALTTPYQTELYSFPHQVSGHASLLRLSSSLLLKPLIPAEFDIYERIFGFTHSSSSSSQSPNSDADSVHGKPKLNPFAQLIPFLPGYFSRVNTKLYFKPKESPTTYSDCLKDSNNHLSLGTFQLSNPTNNLVIPDSKYVTNGGITIRGPLNFETMKSSDFSFHSTLFPLTSQNPVIRRKKIKRPKDREKKSSRLQFPIHTCVTDSWNNKKFSFDLREILTDGSPCFQYLIMENLIHKFNTPVIIDLKLGVRQHSDDAKPKKVLGQIQKCKNSTSYTHGIRFGGCQYFDEKSQSFVCLDKYFGRKAKAQDLETMIWNFFSRTADCSTDSEAQDLSNSLSKYRLELVPFYLDRISTLMTILSKLERVRFFSASILLVYDAQPGETGETGASTKGSLNTDDTVSITSPCCKLPFDCMTKIINNCQNKIPGRINGQDIRLVDFAHSYCDYHQPGPDYGILFGLKNLYKILEKLLKTHGDSSYSAYFDKCPSVDINLEQTFSESVYSIHSPDGSHSPNIE